MRNFLFAAAILGILPAAATAQTYRAINNLYVVPLSSDSFEVIEAYGEGPRGIWCAAAEFAERRLGAKGRIYILAGRGPAQTAEGRKSVVFTTNPQDLTQGPSQSMVLTTRQIGVGLSISHAIQFCRDVYDREDGLLWRYRK